MQVDLQRNSDQISTVGNQVKTTVKNALITIKSKNSSIPHKDFQILETVGPSTRDAIKGICVAIRIWKVNSKHKNGDILKFVDNDGDNIILRIINIDLGKDGKLGYLTPSDNLETNSA